MVGWHGLFLGECGQFMGGFWVDFRQDVLLFNIFLFIYGKLSSPPNRWASLGEYGRNPKFNMPKRHPRALFGIKALIPPSQWMGDSGRVWEIFWELPLKSL